jgi:branched-chain amino acid transport system substrate-binding protein
MVETINAGDDLPGPYASRGFAGRGLSLRVYDESGSESDQVDQLRRIHADGADVVVGYAGSAVAMAIAPVAEELRQLTVISGGGASQLYARPWDWVFRTQTTTTTDSVGAARYVAAQLGVCGLGFGGVNQQYLWGTDSWREFRAALEVLQPDAREVGGHFAPLYSGAVETPIKSLKEQGVQLIHSGNWGVDLFRLVEVARKTIPDARLLLVSGESGLHRLARTIPDGTIIGGRGSHGPLAHDTELNRWFNTNYRDRYEIAPIYPSYEVANALLGLKAAWDRAGAGAATIDAASALAGSTFEGVGSTISMNRAKGRQAVAEAVYGTVRRAKSGEIELTEILRFAPNTVNPPDGMAGLEWIESRFGSL